MGTKDILRKKLTDKAKKVLVPVLQKMTKEEVRQTRRAVEHGVTDAGLLKHVGTMVDANPDYAAKVGFAEMSGLGRILAGSPTNFDLIRHPIAGYRWAWGKENEAKLGDLFTGEGKSAIASVKPDLLEWTVKVDPKYGSNGGTLAIAKRITIGNKSPLATLTHELGHPMGDALLLPRGPANSDGTRHYIQPFTDEVAYRSKLKKIWGTGNHFADTALRDAETEERKAMVSAVGLGDWKGKDKDVAYSFYTKGSDELRNEALAAMTYSDRRKFIRTPVVPLEPAGGSGHIMYDVNGYAVSPHKVMSISNGSAGKDPVPQRMFHQDAKGGDNFKNARALLATDDVPDSIFGIPVVSRPEDYTEEDIAFFEDHPEAGGYYDMEDGDEESDQAAEKAGTPKLDASDPDIKAILASAPARIRMHPLEYQLAVKEEMDSRRKTIGAAVAAPAAIVGSIHPVTAPFVRPVIKNFPLSAAFNLATPDGRKKLKEDSASFAGDAAYEAAQLAVLNRVGMMKGMAFAGATDFSKDALSGDSVPEAAVGGAVGAGVIGALGGYDKLVDKIPYKPLKFALKALPLVGAGAAIVKENLEKQEDAKGGDVDTRNVKGTGVAVNPKKFDTPLPYGREKEYQRWRATLPKPLQWDGDYDLQGYFLDKDTVKTAVEGQHFIDKYKKPNHPTFSVESMYSKGPWAKYAPLAGTWNGDEYVPSELVRKATAKNGDELGDRINLAIGQAIPFIKKHEGFRAKAYQDSIGKWTIGYGQTEIDGRPVRKGDVIDEPTASKFVERRVRDNAIELYRNSTWTNAASANALAALYDLAYNMGMGALSEKKSPTLNRTGKAAVGTNAVDKAIWDQVPTYIRAGGKVLKGLKNRREDAIKAWRK